jgi:hemerythrin-like domain-containing protein
MRVKIDDREFLVKALSSGSEYKIKEALDNHGIIILDELRKHMKEEENSLFTIVVSKYTLDELERVWYKVNTLDKI